MGFVFQPSSIYHFLSHSVGYHLVIWPHLITREEMQSSHVFKEVVKGILVENQQSLPQCGPRSISHSLPVYQLSFAVQQSIPKSADQHNTKLSVSQESGNSLAGCFWLRATHEVVVKMLTRATRSCGKTQASHLKVRLRLEALLPKWLTPGSKAPSRSMLGLDRRPQFLHTWTSPQGYLHVLTTWQLAPPRMKDPTEKL